MDEDINYYKILNAIKNIDLIKLNKEKNNYEEEIRKQFNLEANTKISFEKDYLSLSYKDYKFEEYFLFIENNNFDCSKITYSGIPYEEEFLGLKYYCKDKIIVLIKELNKYSSNFTFHEVNIENNKEHNNDIKNENTDNNKEHNNDIKNVNIYNTDNNKNNKDINKVINYDKNKNDNNNNDCKNNNDYYYNFLKANLFDKIDYQDYNIKGYIFYVYFYIYSLYKNTEKEKELKKNNIFIKIVDDKIDDYIINYINISKKEIVNCNDYIYIFMLVIKEHCAVLIDINGKYFLFDSSYYFVNNLENIFKDLGSKIKTLNKYKIQNLGTCSFHSMNFISVFISSILKDKKKYTADLIKAINSYEFLFEYINQLNKFSGGEDIIFKKNLDNKYLSLENKVYLSKYAYKSNFINFNELFNFLYVYDSDKVSLLLKMENQIYLKECKIVFLKKNFQNLIKDRYKKIEMKKDIFYLEEVASFNKNIKAHDEKQIDYIWSTIYRDLKYKKNIIQNLDENELKKTIKETIKFELKEKYLVGLNNVLDFGPKENKEKKIIDIIIDFIKKNKKDEHFDNEFNYYLAKELLVSEMNNKEETNIYDILQYFEDINTKVTETKGIENEELKKLEKLSLKLNDVLTKLEGIINDIQ